MTPVTTPPVDQESAPENCGCGYSRRGIDADAECPECGLRPRPPRVSGIARYTHRISVWTLRGSIVVAALQVALIINYEVNNSGDGFMLLPLLPWFFLVLPIGLATVVLSLVDWTTMGFSRAVLLNVARVVAAAILLPAIVVYTVLVHARFP